MNKALCAALASFMTLATVAAQGQTYSVLHGFAGTNNTTEAAGSEYPSGPLTLLNGNLYGVTQFGGAYDDNPPEWGTVYSINASTGAGDLIYSFVSAYVKQSACNQSDGIWPKTSLVPYTLNGQNVLYGTTAAGGANKQGTIFQINLTGGECVVWSFENPNFPYDGEFPNAGLVYDTNTNLFYGTTLSGGNSTSGCGTIFSFNPAPVGNASPEQVVYSFQNNGDGCGPQATLILVNGILYGTTSGYNNANPAAQPLGSVFGFNPVTQSMMVNSSGNTMISDFQGGLTDGAQPMAPLVYDQAHNMLYGTTEFGGKGWVANGGHYGYGTIFEVDLSAKTFQETPIYFFTDYTLVNGKPTIEDGRNPLTGLVYDSSNGQYYVTTSAGPDNVANASGVLIGGTLSPGASGSIAHTFKGGSDGAMPIGGLIFENGTIYGTTQKGGGSTNCDGGCGTVFEYVP